MITFLITRYFSSAAGTLGVLTVTTPKGCVTLDTLESRCPNEGGKHKGLCLPVGEYDMECGRTFLDFEGEVKPYPWFFISKVSGYPLASLVSFKGMNFVRGALIQYGHLDLDLTMRDGYEACKELFILLRDYYDTRTYTFKDDVKLIITEREDMERIEAKRDVVREESEFTLMV